MVFFLFKVPVNNSVLVLYQIYIPAQNNSRNKKSIDTHAQKKKFKHVNEKKIKNKKEKNEKIYRNMKKRI